MGKRSKTHDTSADRNDDDDVVLTKGNVDSIDRDAVVIVLPGDNVTRHLTSVHCSTSNNDDTVVEEEEDGGATPSTKPVIRNKLGRGLRVDASTNQVYATFSGRLVHKHCKEHGGSRIHTYFIEPHRTGSIQQQRRYQPAVHDRVVGIVVDRIGTTDEGGGDVYRIDINAAQYGILSNLQFAGATKRNKPILQSGQIVYCRVLNDATTTTIATAAADTTTADTDDETSVILSCMNGPYDVGIPSKDWTTRENCYGELRNGGTLCRVSMPLARNLLISSTILSHDSKKDVHNTIEEHNVILEELAKHNQKIPFEVVIGVNGYVWINSTKPEYIILIQNAVQNSNVLTNEQIRAMVKNLVYIIDKQLQQRNEIS